jgi:hypothetical protein
VNLVDEEDTRYELSNALVDVTIDDLVDLSSQFLCNLCLFRFHDLTHETHEVIAALGTSIGHVEIVQGNILYDLFLFVNVTLWEGNVLLSL